MTHNKKYEDQDNLPGIEKLRLDLREDGQWFIELLIGIKEKWIDRDIPLTDVLILENEEILVSVVKSHVPYIDPDTKATVVVGAERIKRVVATLMDIDPETLNSPRDFSLTVDGIGSWRGNISIDNDGFGLSLRYLPPTPPKLEEMRYPDFYVRHLKTMPKRFKVKTSEGDVETKAVSTAGLYLHVGPTSSGKTTSIAAEMYYLASVSSGTVLSYEDPIEYRFTGATAPVRQFDIRENILGDEPFERAAEMVQAHLLRNNPTVVNMGEGRRPHEIRGMLDTALRGHLVYGTMHASNVSEALSTLSLVAEGNGSLIASGVRGIVAHKLVTNNEGDLLPLYEILLFTEEIRKTLSSDPEGIEKIKNLVERQKGKSDEKKHYWSFNDSINAYRAIGLLDFKDAKKYME
jgi:Tfp pilus assembly pilus retraction ATPase PilT